MLEDIDLVALYAHCDASEGESRASWRGFLSFVIALLLQVDAETSDELVTSSIAAAPDDMDSRPAEPFVHEIHVLSANLASGLGMTQEFGLAALLDFNPPTRTHPIRKSSETQDDLVRLWLSRFQLLQSDEGFQNVLAHWRERLVQSLNHESAEEHLLAREMGTGDSADEAPGESEPPPQEPAEPAQSLRQTRGRRRRSA